LGEHYLTYNGCSNGIRGADLFSSMAQNTPLFTCIQEKDLKSLRAHLAFVQGMKLLKEGEL